MLWLQNLRQKTYYFGDWITFVSTGSERVWINFGIRRIRPDQERPPENPLIGADGPDDSMFQSITVAVSSGYYIQNSFKIVGWDKPASQNTPVNSWL